MKNLNWSTGALLARGFLALIIVALLAAVAAHSQNVITDWNAIAITQARSRSVFAGRHKYLPGLCRTGRLQCSRIDPRRVSTLQVQRQCSGWSIGRRGRN